MLTGWVLRLALRDPSLCFHSGKIYICSVRVEVELFKDLPSVIFTMGLTDISVVFVLFCFLFVCLLLLFFLTDD